MDKENPNIKFIIKEAKTQMSSNIDIKPMEPVINTDNCDNIDNIDNINNEKELCPICLDALDSDDIVTLKCNHKYHYNCILHTYKMKISGNKYNSLIRMCPYCRDYGGYLELCPNIFPLKHIHKEFNKIMDCINNNDFDRLEKITENFINKNKCYAILKSGDNKGNQCSRKKVDGNYCTIHKKYKLN